VLREILCEQIGSFSQTLSFACWLLEQLGPGRLHRETGIKRKRGRDLLFPSPTRVCWLFGKSFSEWKSSGQDRGSIIADPLFVNAGNFDFRLPSESPALKTGFRQIDMTTVGPRLRAGADAW
jgi:hypothetical protein